MALWSSAAFKLFSVTVLLLAIFTLYGQSHFYRDPGSAFYQPSRAFERKYSSLRLAQSREFLDGLEASASTTESLKDWRPERVNTKMCISITTIKREGVGRQYIEDALASLVEGMTPEERASVHINLVFADANVGEHPTYHKPSITSLADTVWTHESIAHSESEEIRKLMRESAETGRTPTKSTLDYTLALEKCLSSSEAPYITVLEGDVLVARGWLAPTLVALRQADGLVGWNSSGSSDDGTGQSDWIDVRLFNQERSTGWSSRRIGGNNELYIAAAVNAVVVAALWLPRHKFPTLRRHVDGWTLIILCLFTIPAMIILFFQSGKASLLPPGLGLRVENFGCCSQALVFNRRVVPSLIDYLRAAVVDELDNGGHTNYDMRTADFARDSHLQRLALYPMQVQHMGIKSASGTAEGEAQAIWSMAFEDLNPATLEMRHTRAMTELFGLGWGGESDLHR